MSPWCQKVADIFINVTRTRIFPVMQPSTILAEFKEVDYPRAVALPKPTHVSKLISRATPQSDVNRFIPRAINPFS